MENLNELLKKRGMTYYRFAKLIRTSPSTISAWRAGKCEPNAKTLKKIADVLDVSVDYLLGLTTIITQEEKEVK